MPDTIKQKVWNIIHAVFKIKIFEKMLLPFVKGKYLNTRIVALAPYHHMYQNPTYRIASKNDLQLKANLYDFNDWKAYWGVKEIERESLYALAKDAANVVDIGTNNGWVLINLATIVKKNNGFVYGFEPHPDTYNRCIQNVQLNNLSNCEVFNMGCGDFESELLMTTEAAGNSGQNRIVSGEKKEAASNIVNVKVTTLDKQLAKVKKIDLIKIDVEGFELHVLKGADALLKKHKPVIFMEVNDPLLKLNGTSGKELVTLLKNVYGYKIVSASTGEEVTDNTNFIEGPCDIVCHPSKQII